MKTEDETIEVNECNYQRQVKQKDRGKKSKGLSVQDADFLVSIDTS